MPTAKEQLKAAIQLSGLSKRWWYRTVYLKSDHWLALREEALKNHGAFCHVCDRDEDLQVHHLRYRSIFNVKLSDLQILCRRCHEAEHAKKKNLRKTKKKQKPSRMTRKQRKSKEQSKRARANNVARQQERHGPKISWKRHGGGFK